MKQRSVMILAVVLTSLCLWGCGSHDEDQKLDPAAPTKAPEGAPAPPTAGAKSTENVGAAPTLQLNPGYKDKTGTKAKQ